MDIIDRIKYWWMIRKYPKPLRTYPITKDIYCIKLKNGKAHYVKLPSEEDAFPIAYINTLKAMANSGIDIPKTNNIEIDEEKIKNKDIDWMDEE